MVEMEAGGAGRRALLLPPSRMLRSWTRLEKDMMGEVSMRIKLFGRGSLETVQSVAAVE